MPKIVVFDQVGAPDVLHVVDQPLTEPAEGHVRIRIEAFGVNRLDALVRAGHSPRPIALPGARLGLEGTGVVDALGPGAEGLREGDAVIITAVPDFDVNGTYAEYVTVPATRVILRPEGLDVTTAAAFWSTYSTAYGAMIEKAGMRPGDRVLITAASGGVGLAAIQVANQIGAVPLAVTRSAAKEEALLAAGAAAVIATDREDLVGATKEHTIEDGADLVIDSVMGPGLADLASAVRFGGTLVTVGWLDPRPAPMPMVAPLTIHRYMGFEHVLDPVVVRRMAAFLGAGVRSGVLRPVVEKVFGIDDVASAHAYLEDGQQVGKIVVTV